MNTDTKKYKLLKDLPYVEKGAIYTFDGLNYECYNGNFIDGITSDRLHKNSVEKTSWFELVEPSKEVQERIKVLEVDNHRENNQEGYWYQFITNKEVWPHKFDEVKQAIEDSINGGVVRIAKSYWKRLHEDYEGLTEKLAILSEAKKEADNSKPFVWTDDLVLLLCDFCHHNGYHKFDKRVVDEFDEFKSIPCHKRMIPQWIKDHVNKSKQSPPLTDDKDKPVLFTTEDGVGITGCDCYWAVNKNFSGMSRCNGKGWHKPQTGEKYFSTKEAAEDYILRYKPVLCLNDCVVGLPGKLFNMIEQKAKEKINQSLLK